MIHFCNVHIGTDDTLLSKFTSDLHATSYMYVLIHVCFMDSLKKKLLSFL